MPPREEKLLLRKGDTLLLTPDSGLGRPAIMRRARPHSDAGEHRHHAPGGLQGRPARRGDVVRRRQNRRGRAGGGPERITVEITQAGPAGAVRGRQGHQPAGYEPSPSPLTPRTSTISRSSPGTPTCGVFVRSACRDIHELQDRLADLKAGRRGSSSRSRRVTRSTSCRSCCSLMRWAGSA